MSAVAALEGFLSLFDFKKELRGYVGIERERFLEVRGRFVPRAEEFLRLIDDPLWTYELSACQVEDRTNPKLSEADIKLELEKNDNHGNLIADKMGLNLIAMELAPEDMPLTVYPDARYLAIAKNISRERLSAACRVAGTHIHLGMGSMEEAIRAHNILVPYLETLCKLGDHSDGGRIRLYKEMAVNWKPIIYRDEKHLFEVAVEQGFTDNPRNCYHLIRISRHGTIELRMFGVTSSIDEILSWIEFVRNILRQKEVLS